MSDPLRNLFDKSKPLFEGKGRFARFFPLFDVFENLFYSSERKTSGLTHVRDAVSYTHLTLPTTPYV